MASLASMEMLTNHPGWQPRALRVMSPVVRPIYDRFFNGGLVLAAIMEDLPYLDNRVLPSDRPSSDGRQRLRFSIGCTPVKSSAAQVFAAGERGVEAVSQTHSADRANNSNLGHVCGTCRFGTDPKTSVLDPQNRAHEVDNLYVVDASFFPSSSRFESQFNGRRQRLAGGRAHQPGAFRQTTTRRTRSADRPQTSEILHKIRGRRNAVGGFGHPSGDLAGSGERIAGRGSTQVRDQRFLGGGRKAPGGTHFQPFDGAPQMG